MKKNKLFFCSMAIGIVVILILLNSLMGSGSISHMGASSTLIEGIENLAKSFDGKPIKVQEYDEIVQVGRYYIYLFVTDKKDLGYAVFLKNKAGEKGYVIQEGHAEEPYGSFSVPEINIQGVYSSDPEQFDSVEKYEQYIHSEVVEQKVIQFENLTLYVTYGEVR